MYIYYTYIYLRYTFTVYTICCIFTAYYLLWENEQLSPAESLPDDVIIVSQVELLGVFSGVVDHTHPGHEVHHLFSCGVEQVVTTLVASVSVDPLQPQLAARRRLIRHIGFKPEPRL